MSQLISKLAVAGALALAAASLCAAPAAADSPRPDKAKTHAKPKAKAKPQAAAAASPDEAEPDLTDTTTSDYNCELGNKITIYTNDKDDSHIALRWKKRVHRLSRVGTTTGAKRFENAKFGLVWIGIPSKGMLLDSKLNRQLANECKNAEQAKPVLADPTEAKKS